MKIIYVAVYSDTSTNNSQARSFESLGHKVGRYDYRARSQQLGSDQARNTEIIECCKRDRPDLVIFSKCNEVSTHVIEECNKICKTVLWYMDPFNINFGTSLTQKIEKCDFTFCALHDSFLEAQKIAGSKVHFLHEGFDQDIDKPAEAPYEHDVSFIGNLRNERATYYDQIGFHLFSNVFGEDHANAVAKSKINLNFTEGGTSDRTYKVLASRGFLLTQPWPNMENDFIIGKDLDTFTSTDELKEKITFYLENETKRLNIAENGYHTVQKFNRINWAERIIKETIV